MYTLHLKIFDTHGCMHKNPHIHNVYICGDFELLPNRKFHWENAYAVYIIRI